jgi:hypothetical protein
VFRWYIFVYLSVFMPLTILLHKGFCISVPKIGRFQATVPLFLYSNLSEPQKALPHVITRVLSLTTMKVGLAVRAVREPEKIFFQMKKAPTLFHVCVGAEPL